MNTQQALHRELAGLYGQVPTQSRFDRWFERLRLHVLPLPAIDAVVPREGVIVEIGCGHGLVANYLAMTAPGRQVIGVDIDPRRIAIAKATVGARTNIEFLEGRFETLVLPHVQMVVLFGVLCLIPLSQWEPLFAAIRAALAPGGLVLLHDIRKDDSVRYRLHTWKEDIFRITGITRGEGLHVLPAEILQQRLTAYGFTAASLGSALDVSLHSCFSWLLTPGSATVS